MVTSHFTFVDNFAALSQLLPLIEKTLRPFGGRSHMGKVFTMTPARVKEVGFDTDLLAPFCPLVQRYDPEGCFTNKFVETYVLGNGSDRTVVELHHQQWYCQSNDYTEAECWQLVLSSKLIPAVSG
jgi:hypothetical protein